MFLALTILLLLSSALVHAQFNLPSRSSSSSDNYVHVQRHRTLATNTSLFPVGKSPVDVAFDGNGDAWVVCQASNEVYKMSGTGNTLGIFSVGNHPSRVAIDASGNAWVSNTNDNTVSRISSTGQNLGAFPVGLLPMGLAIASTGNVI